MASSPSLSSTKDSYLLNRDSLATIRLNCQHWVWHQELGYNLHPTITLPLHGRIADVATGTGAWLLEVAREKPGTQCDGFDIRIDQAPPTCWLPPNVSMREWNMYEPPPAELIGTYDVVHIRLVAIVVQHQNSAPIVRNLALLLKPHGWLQWDEIDISDSVVTHTSGEGGKTAAVQRMDGLMKGHGSSAWILELPSTMVKEDLFEEATIHRLKPKMSLLKFNTENTVESWAELASNQAEGSEQRKKFEQLVREMHEETRQGAAHSTAKVICVGRKAA